MAEYSKKTKKYIPNPFEAAALKELHQPWRFYTSKEEFEKVVAEFSKKTFQTEVGETNKWDAARANGLISFGAKLYDYEKDSLDAAEKQIRNSEELWKKVQAAHLYNTAGFKPEISLDSGEDISAEDILKRINENLDKLESGKMVDGRYQPSKAERNVLRTLSNYGEFVRNPHNEDEIAKFRKDIKRKLSNISKRDDYQEFETNSMQKQNKNQRKEKTMSEENTFKLKGEDLEFCTAHGINPKKITSREAFEAKKAEIENTENSEDKEDKDNNKKESSEKSEKENKDEYEDEDKKKAALKVHVGEPNTDDKTNDEIPDWVKRKAEYYQGLADKGEITDYKQDTSKQGFAAEFNNAEIHYTSETEVTVSEDAGFKVFDAMLKEKDNEGRPVEFPENASKEVATRMYAACVLNGNPMQGAVPKELDAETLAKCGLTEEQVKQVQEHMAASQQQNNEQQKNVEENSEQKNGEEKQISAKVQEDIKKLTEIRNNFNKMKQDGKIAIQEDEQGKPKIVAGEKGSPEDVKAAVAIMQEADDLVKAGLKSNRGENTKLETQEQKDTNEALRQQQIENLRAKMSSKQIKTHQDNQDARYLAIAARLGIAPKGAKVTDHKGNEVTAKTGKDLEQYKSHISKKTMAAIMAKTFEGAEN